MATEKKSLYLETTIPSYATARTSADVISAARQAMTRLFWEQYREKYKLFVSQDVIDECKLGNPEAAQKRLALIAGITVLKKSDEIATLAAIYQKLLKIPDRAKTDCSHLAVCVTIKINYLLTWNCTHLGMDSYVKVRDYNDKRGLWTPFLVTPEDLLYSTKEESV
ncbi:MAG: type II toxin-antitoxin system VapC family toxin [Treponema sp.]|jgi:hypothetical protein|nr:type II toxin-antitoxin system VapC family toxin [Treponema sp.]